MSPRERGLRAGHREHTYIGEFQIVLYWELYGGPMDSHGHVPILEGFTVDRNHPSFPLIRRRYDTLEEADKAIDIVKDQLAVAIAKQAFGLN